MFFLALLKILARLLAALPPSVVRAACVAIGGLVGWVLPRRRRLALNSLSHAYPEKSESWRYAVYREASARMVEMGLFRLAAAYFGPKRAEQALKIGADAREIIARYETGGERHGHPVVIFLPHMTMSEAATLLPARGKGLNPVHVIFRPLNQPSINRWVTVEREKYGAHMISRRAGHNEAMAALRRGEIVAVLFDQDAASRGSIISFMGRAASATDLPALMAHRFGADTFLMLPERRGFWQAELSLTPIPLGEKPADTTIAAHLALERYLRRDQNTAADWLWLHNRWNFRYKPQQRFHLPSKRNHLARSMKMAGDEELPSKTRFWVRLPDSVDELASALPVLRAIHVGRPDFEFTLIGKAVFRPLADRLGIADHYIPLPKRGIGYFSAFFALRKQYPDTYLLLTDSFRGDLEAFLTRCPQRFGLVSPRRRRPLLSDPVKPAEDESDEGRIHKTLVWEQMARAYGLREALDLEPFVVSAVEKQSGWVGIVCGAQDSSGECWPVSHWRALISGLIESKQVRRIVLFSAGQGTEFSRQIALGFDRERVVNRASWTDPAEFCDKLLSCSVVCGTDCGELQLANLLGTATVTIFGLADPLCAKPIFNSPHWILQPGGCPPTGGLPAKQVSVESCLEAVRKALLEESDKEGR